MAGGNRSTPRRRQWHSFQVSEMPTATVDALFRSIIFLNGRRSKPGMPKQPYAIGMKSGEPFALAGIWENWKRPETEEWVRTFAIITTNSNELVSAIHDRMPVIIAPEDYTRWLSPLEPDPRDLLVPYAAEPMTMWPISTRVNKPDNDDASILDRVPGPD